jgi:multidrug efflux pump subunit AcrA (membrane-fusion protein)
MVRALGLILVFTMVVAGDAAAQGPPMGPPPPVVVATVIEREIVPSQAYVGTVQATRRSIIGSAVDGRVERMLVEEGDWVQYDGQELPVVAQLRTKTIEIEIAAAEAALEMRKHELEEMKTSRPEEVAAAEARMRAAEALMKFATDKYERDKKLFEQNRTVSQEEYQRSLSASDSAIKTFDAARSSFEMVKAGARVEKRNQGEAMVRMAQEEVNRLNDRHEKYFIKSPFSGYVVAKNTEIGAWIRPGEPVVEVIEVDPIEVVIHVPQQQANQLVPGMPVQLATDAIPATLVPGGALVGQVSAVVPNADLKTRTFPVKIRVRNPLRQAPATAAVRDPAKVIYKPGERPDHLLKPGMMARATLRIGAPAKAVLVPKDAVVINGALRQVAIFTADAGGKPGATTGKIELVNVETGGTDGATIEILGGALKPGQFVVTQGNERLRPGQPVTAIRTVATESLVTPNR